MYIHLSIKNTFVCPNGVQIREVPLYTYVHNNDWMDIGHSASLIIRGCRDGRLVKMRVTVSSAVVVNDHV